MVKLLTVTKNINVKSVSINLRRINPVNLSMDFYRLTRENILLALVAAKLHSSTATLNIIPIFVVVIKNVITRFLCVNQRQLRLHQCQICLVKLTLNVCVILFIPFYKQSQCFILAQHHFEKSP